MAGSTIILYSNYPSGTNTNNSCPEGQALPNPTTEWAWNCNGYVFSHWNTQSNGSGTSYNVGSPAPFYTLYAIWSADQDYLTNTSELTSVADAIRTKGGTAASLSFPVGFINAISAIPTGITPAGTLSISSNGTYDVTNYASASVNVPASGYTIDDIAKRNMMSGNIVGSASFVASCAFYSCSMITGASFSKATSISQYAFYSCTSLSAISFPIARSLESYAFARCTKLATADFPKATSIGQYTFMSCTSLSSISFPEATHVGAFAFCSCYSLTAVEFPKVITGLGGSTQFGYCSSLVTARFTKALTVATFMFAGCRNLTTVDFPSASKIGQYAFSGCSNLTSISFPNVETIEGNAFASCIKLERAYFPLVSKLDQYVFYRCYNLVGLYLTSITSVPSLAYYVFSSTPIGGYTTSTGGVYGSVFVPSSLYASFLTATNWASISARIVSV